MRVISKFHDYYDINLAYGVDPKCVYVRKTEEYDFTRLTDANPAFIQQAFSDEHLNKLATKEFHAKGWTWSHRNEYQGEDFDVRLILFCGKLYLAFGFRGEYHYDPQSLEAAVDASGDEAVQSYFRGDDKHSYYGDERKTVQRAYEAVAKLNERKSFLDEILIAAKSPIVEFQANTARVRGVVSALSRVTVNPELKPLGFPRVMDSVAAFQELSMYLTNVIGIPENPMCEVDDASKAAKHGYNELSFRNPTKL